MKKIAVIIYLIAITAVAASAEPQRRAANVYVLDDGAAVLTKDCTANTHGLTAEIQEEPLRGKAWLVLIDRDGEEEAACEVAMVVRRLRTEHLAQR